MKDLVNKYGKSVYIVGGSLRNEYMGMSSLPKDIDLVCESAEEFTMWLKKNSTAKDFSIYGRSGCISFKIGRKKYECTSLIGNSLLEDSLHRDFCCNCIYQDLLTSQIYDPTGRGISDAKNKILKTPVNPEITFQDDPLRMLRAFRFQGKYGMTIDQETYDKIKPYPEYLYVSMERIRDEFSKILQEKKPSEIIREIHERRLLSHILPFLEEAWGFNQNSKYHSMNLTDHLLSVLDKVPRGLLRWAALLHDISKYKDYQVKPTGEFSFKGHEVSSSKMAEYLLSRLKMPSNEIKEISGLIRYHMYLKQYYNYDTDSYTGSPRVTRRFLRKLSEDGVNLGDLLCLINADNNSHSPKYNMPGQIESFKQIRFSHYKAPRNRVSGDLIMKELGLTQGKKVGEVKEIMEEYLDKDPTLDFNSLLQKYLDEFGGKTFEISALGSKCIIGDDSMYISNKSGLSDGVYQASQYPKLYKSFIEQKEMTIILGEAFNVLSKLQRYPNFKSLKLVSDDYGDYSATIERNSDSPIHII